MGIMKLMGFGVLMVSCAAFAYSMGEQAGHRAASGLIAQQARECQRLHEQLAAEAFAQSDALELASEPAAEPAPAGDGPDPAVRPHDARSGEAGPADAAPGQPVSAEADVIRVAPVSTPGPCRPVGTCRN